MISNWTTYSPSIHRYRLPAINDALEQVRAIAIFLLVLRCLVRFYCQQVLVDGVHQSSVCVFTVYCIFSRFTML